MSATAPDTAQVPAEEPKAAERPAKHYGFSSLISGFARMWRGWRPALIVIVINMVVQGLLTYWNVQVGMNAAFIVALIVSAVVLLACYAVLTATALAAVDGRIGTREAVAMARRRIGPFVLWVLVQWVVVVAVSLVNGWLGLIAAAVLIFLPIAAIAGSANPLRANFVAIRDRWIRWLVTCLILLFFVIVWVLLAAVNVFFVHGMGASLIAWLVIGLAAWWLLTAWSAIFRSTRAGAEPQPLESGSSEG